MPFKSAKQRKFLFSQKPAVAKKFMNDATEKEKKKKKKISSDMTSMAKKAFQL